MLLAPRDLGRFQQGWSPSFERRAIFHYLPRPADSKRNGFLVIIAVGKIPIKVQANFIAFWMFEVLKIKFQSRPSRIRFIFPNVLIVSFQFADGNTGTKGPRCSGRRVEVKADLLAAQDCLLNKCPVPVMQVGFRTQPYFC